MIQIVSQVLLVIAAMVAIVRPVWALAMVISMYALEQLLQSAGGIFLSIPALTNITVAAVAGIAALRVMATQERPFLGYFNRAWMVTVVIFAWSAISLLWTPSPESGGKLVSSGIPYFILFVVTAPMLFVDVASLARLGRVLLLLGGAIAAALVANPEFRSWSGRQIFMLAGSVMSNPLATGELGGTIIITAVLLRGDGLTPFMVLMRLVAFPLGLALALQSGSRGQLVSAVIVCFVFYPVAKRITTVIGFVGAVGATIIGYTAFSILAPIILTGYGITRWDTGSIEGSVASRFQNVIDLMVAQFRAPLSWVVGLGYNAFTAISDGTGDGYSHNLSADILTELGMPMFALYVWMLVSACRDGLWLFRRYQDRPAERSSVALLLALASYQFLLMHKQGYLWGAGAYFMFVIAIGRIRRREEALVADPALEHHATEPDVAGSPAPRPSPLLAPAGAMQA
jgi:hypothetical protein